jgi:plastocyanin
MGINLKPVHWMTFLIILLISIGAAGCMGTQQPSGSPTPQQTTMPAGNSVLIQNFAFSPPALPVARGSTVTWINKDSVDHQIVSDASGSQAEGAIFTSNPLPIGASYSFKFDIPGTYPYHCSIHPSMKGTITVQ